MRNVMVLMGMVLFVPVVWADYQTTPVGRIDAATLMNELQAAVPETGLCNDTYGVITCQRKIGDFTNEEKAQMDTVVAIHDPDIQAKQKRQDQENEQELPLEAFGAGAAGALAMFGGKNLVLRAQKKKPPVG